VLPSSAFSQGSRVSLLLNILDPLSALLALIGVVSLLQVAHEWRTPRGGDE
jgi:hypothetical protein